MGADERNPAIDPRRQQAVAAALRAFLPLKQRIDQRRDGRDEGDRD